MRHWRLIAIVSCILILAALLLSQVWNSTSASADLDDWVGVQCTVHLRLESDPRAGRSSFHRASNGLLETIEEIPVSVSGTIVSVNRTGVGVKRGQSIVWIPRNQIRVIIGTIQPEGR